MDTTTMTIRLSTEMKARLEKLAEQQSRSKSYIANEAIRDFLDFEDIQIAKIERGLAQAAAGKTFSSEEAERRIDSWDFEQNTVKKAL